MLGLIWFATGVLSVAVAEDPHVFTDVTAEAGITFKHSYGDVGENPTNIVEGTGAGVTFFDFDGDGWQDIYFVNGTWNKDVNDNMGRKLRGKLSNCLYRNKHDGTFEDVTAKAGVADPDHYGYSSSAADYDGDGDLDLYVLNYEENVLFRNNGDGTFTDVSAESGLANPHWSLNAPWFDCDGDGDLDVYVVNYLEYDNGKFRAFYPAAGYPGPLSYGGSPDALYRNNGDGTFTDVTVESGVEDHDGRGMSATVVDLDNDGMLDIYVANDAMENFFYRNLGGGKFENEAVIRNMAFGEGGQGVSSMGPAVGDVDGDGWFDIYIPDMGYGCLLMNAEGTFEDRTSRTNLAVICGQYIGWGGVIFDWDNDTLPELFVANGNAHFMYPEEDVFVKYDGKGTFVDIAAQSGEYFHNKYVGRGATCADYDNDGDLDLLVVNLNDTPRLLRNDGGNRQHWLKLDLRLANGKSPAIGALVYVTVEGRRQMQQVQPVIGYLSQVDVRSHFGLGAATKAEKVEIRWPNGEVQELQDVAADQILTVVQGAK
jgi:hypothetical protein